MSSHLTHERCSELLAAYLAGELDHEQHRLVQDHLEHCAQCSAERAALAALRSDDEGGGLTAGERAVLRKGVLDAIREPDATSPLQDESDAVVVPLGGRGARAGKYLGIAAMLAILAVGSLFVLRGGGLGVSGGDDGDAESSFGGAEDSGEAGGGDEDAPRTGGAEEESFSLPRAWNVRPQVQSDRGVISEGDLDRLGRRAAPAPADSALTDESEELRNSLLSDRAPEKSLARLGARAGAALAPDVAECGRTALAELERPGLATYATTATIEGEDVVIIAFVTGDRTPDRYAVFAFPRGDCTTILTSTEGPLD
jgi:hypothetical protein